MLQKSLEQQMHEFQIIKKYFSILSKKNKSSINLNDDIFFDKSKKLAISIDTYVEGIHFIDFKKPNLVIKKILRSSISDLICKGVKPKYYFISGSGKSKNFTHSNLRKISNALRQEQKKYDISLSGGDTVLSDKLSFTITSVGFSNNVIFRNNAKINDSIYVTGNLGDSFIGLSSLKNKLKIPNNLKKYFGNKYYLPEIYKNIPNKLFLFANTSIDISDGLISDLDKLINKQKLSYTLYLDKIPISKNLEKLMKLKRLKKSDIISRGDDYQILFTANSSKNKIIENVAKSLGIKISKIGKISSKTIKSMLVDKNGNEITIKKKGYFHTFWK